MNSIFKFRVSLSFISMVIAATIAGAQGLDMKKLNDFKPRNIGPSGMSGRVTAIDVVLRNPDIIYAGTASGGIWKSESGGVKWEPIFDEMDVQSIGSISIQQDNPDVIWVGTGEGNPRNSLNSGAGIYKSIDGGKTWKKMGLERTRNIHRIIIHRDNPDVVYAGAIGTPWGTHPERGVYRTKDGGKSWDRILFVNNQTGVADMVVDPGNPNKLIVATWEHIRKPWTFTSGGKGSGIHVSFDGGDSWVKRSSEDGLPEGELGRIGLAIAPSNPQRIYALVEAKKNALYRSDDGGFKWKKINDKDNIGNRPFYYSEIYVDPKNDNRVYSLFSFVNVSEDGGKSFSRFVNSYGISNGVHPDHHAWWIHPDDPTYMIEGNDGGLNITRDGGKTWRFAENIPVAQYYHINVDNDYPYNVYGGMQDNGSWAGPAYVWKSQGIRNSYWQEISFGDGFDVVPDPDNSRWGYSMSQGGFVLRYDRVTGHTKVIRPTHPDADTRLRFNWNAAIAQDPFDNSTIYYGSQFVHKSTNKGDTWEIISQDLTTNDPAKQKQHESGGLTLDDSGAENFTTIISIEPSAMEQGLMWVGSDDGRLHVTRNGGQSWQEVTAAIQAAGMPRGAWIPQIRASRHNAGEAFVVVNNYRLNDYRPYAFRTRDYGATWQRIASESNVTGYCLSLVQDPVEKRLIFLGTDFGMYVSLNEGATWTKFTNEYPSVPTMDMVIQEREHDLVIGTFGRAAWVLDDIRPLREMASGGTSVLNKKLHVFDAPDATIALNQQPTGTRFAGDAIYSGENRRRGAMITYVINKPEKKKPEAKKEETETKGRKKKKKDEPVEEPKKEETPKVKYDSLVFEVIDGNGNVIRTIKSKVDAEKNGVNRFYWGLNQKGVRGPSRRSPRKNAPEPGGQFVLPGSYKVRMTFGDQKDSTTVKVGVDPRVEISDAVMQARYDKVGEIEKYIALAGRSTKRLHEAKKIAEEYGKQLKARKGDEWKELKDGNKAVLDSINNLMDLMVGKENKKQGFARNPIPTPTSYLFGARFYVQSSLDMPSATVDRLIEQGEGKLMPAIEKVNKFFEEQWPEYRSAMEAADLSPFKDYEPLELE